MTQYEKLEEVLQDELIRSQVANMHDPDEVYALVTEEGVDIPKEAFLEFLGCMGEAVAEKMEEAELTEDDLDTVAGGTGLFVTIGGLTVKVTGAAAAAFGTGMAIGVGVGVAALAGVALYSYLKKK